MLRRDYLFLIFLFFAFINPLSIFFLNTPFAFLFSVTLTVILWIGIRWRGSIYRGNSFEIILGSSLLVGNYARNLLGILGGGQIGIFDIFLIFLGSYIIFYGVRGLRTGTGPLIYFGLIYVVYQAEFAFPVLVQLEYAMLNQIAPSLSLIGMKAEVFGDFIRLTTQVETYFLQIGGPFAGIKGFLSYAPLSVLLVLDLKTSRMNKTLLVSFGIVSTFLISLARIWLIFFIILLIGIDLGLATRTFFAFGLYLAWVILFKAVIVRA